jgi:sulfur carrier protein ThiS
MTEKQETKSTTKAVAKTPANAKKSTPVKINKSVVSKSATKPIEINSNTKLKDLIEQIQNNKTEGVVTFDNGNTYTKVDYRIKKARQVFGFDMRIINNIIDRNDREVVVECCIYIRNENKDWDMVQNAHAQETKAANHINNYNYVEVAETSAMGRALAGLGLFGNEFASVNEMAASSNHMDNKTPTSSATSTKREPKKIKKINATQIATINDFLNKNKDITLGDVLDGKNAKKLEELSQTEAKEIIVYLTESIDIPL